jgi:hypothetical protein
LIIGNQHTLLRPPVKALRKEFEDAKRKRDSGQPQDAKRKRDSAQPQ